jgi:formate dehydrogenase subunit beta
MRELETLLQETARQLLAEGGVEVIIGYERGTLPLRTTPCFIRDPDQVGRLVWNVSCENNLAMYLHHVTGKVGIVAKGCDARSIVSEIVERQISREEVVIIGVPCQGVMDRWKIEARLDGREVLEAHVHDRQVALRGVGFEEILEVQEVLCDGCITCQHRTPPLCDVLIGEPSEDVEDADEYAALRALEAQAPDERWAYFTNEFSHCIRCYACRQACPCCYCAECFVDQTQPSWFGKSDDLADVMAFHLVRAYHLAGRCVNCGACSRACPMHIDLRALLQKLQKDVRELYGYEAGMDLEALPPLATFRPDDPQEFIK